MKKSILAILVVLLLVGLFAFSAFGEETTVTFAPYTDTDADGIRQYCACGNKFVADAQGTVKYVNGEDGCKNHKDENGNIIAGCDGTLLSWKPWSTATALPRYQSESVKDEESGLYYCYYYLTSTVNLSGQMSIGSLVNVYLDLNGHTVNGASNARVYSVHNNGAGLTLTDTVGTGSINTVGTKADRGMVLWARNYNYTRLCGITMYGGTLNASTVTNATNGAGVRVDASQSFNMFGGKIIGGIATNGGSLYVASSGTATIYDGTITEGTATSGGGNICVAGTIEIYNADVSNGRATNGGGGNVLVNATGTATISGGTFSYGNSSAQGGNLRVDSGGTLTINGGTFQYGGMDPETKEVTTTQGGNLVVLSDNVSITGGHFIGGQAQTYGGNIRTGKALTLGKGVILEDGKSDCGGNLANASGGTITIDGATIRDGEATTSGGNIYNAENKTLNIASGTISGGTADSGGSIASVSTLNISGGTISGGSASTNGGNIYSTGGFTMTGGQVSGGTASNNGGNIWTNDLTLSGGSIYDGTCTENRAYDTTNKVYTDNVNTGVGGNLYLGGDAQFAMTGGDIYNGVINGNNGGNIFVFGKSSGESVVSITAGRIWGGNVNADGSKASTAALKSLDDVMGGSIYFYKEGTYSIGGTATIGLDANGNEDGGHSHHGGNITVYLGTLTISDDVIITGGNADGEGGNLQCYSGAAVNMTSGTVRNGQANNGGNVLNGGTFNMSGGKIINGTAANRGGNIQSFRGNSGTFTMSDDAEVSGGTAGKYGGNFFLGGVNTDTRYGTLVMNGGTVSGGTASGTYGGNIAVNNMGKLVLNDGTINGGTAATNGGNIYVASVYAVCQINGGTISGGTAANGGSIFNAGTMTITGGSITGGQGAVGGNIYTKDSLTLSDVTIDDGVANGGITVAEDGTVSGGDKTYGGGNIYMEAGELNIQDGTTISDGTTWYACGGNIYADKGTINMTGGTISGGDSKTNNKNTSNDQKCGGNVALQGAATFNISGGTVTGGYAHEGGNFRVSNQSTLNISGDALITLGSAGAGGNINTYGVVNMSGGTISGGTATGNGGNVQCFRSTTTRLSVFTMTGGTISGGTANRGGNVYASGTDGKTGYFVMEGGNLIGGTANLGKDLYVNNLGDATVKGGTVGDVYVISNATDVGGILTLAGNPAIATLFVDNDNNLTVDASDLACTKKIAVSVTEVGSFANSSVDTSACFSCEAEYEVCYDTAAQKLYVRYPIVQDVYVSASGNDLAAGNEANPVQTFARALNIVADGGTIHLVGVVDVSGWTAHDKSITVTGDEMNVTKGNPFYIRDSVHFKNMTMRFSTVTADTNDTAGKHRVYALGNKVIIDEDVTVKYGADGSGVVGLYVHLYGGGNDSNVVSSTDLTVLSGTWGRICGGSNGSDISGDVHLTVGGNVNKGVDYADHSNSGKHIIHGGSSGGDIGGTVYMNVTGGTHTSTHGASIGAADKTYTIGGIEMHVTGGEGMAIYGGGSTGLNQVTGEANIYIEGGYYEQVFGGGLTSFEGTLNLFVTGGEVSRRVYGGCYNEWLLTYKTSYQVNGTVNLYIGENANLSLNYESDRALFAHSRYSVSYSDNETNRIIFLNKAAYDKYNSKLGNVSGSVLGSSTRAADYICYLGWSASDNVITAGATQVKDYVSDALDLASATATVNVEQESYEYRGTALTPATVTYSDNWTHGDVVLTYANNNAGGTATATITANGVSANKSFEILDYSVTVVINGETKTYYNLQEAIDAAGKGGLVQLTADVTQSVTINTDLYLDMNGYDINGTVTVAEGATLYGMDSTTDDYDCSDGYGKISKIEGSYAATHKTELDSKVGRILRYLAVVEDDGVSFHRFYLGIQSVSLKPGTAGLGYKAIFGGDEKVKAMLSETDAFGYGLWIAGSENAKQTRYKDGAAFVTGSSGNVLTLGLNNVMSTAYTVDMNKANSEIVIYAEVYMVINGEVITSASYSYTLKELVEEVDDTLSANNGAYNEIKVASLKKMYQTYGDIMKDWELAYINKE